VSAVSAADGVFCLLHWDLVGAEVATPLQQSCRDLQSLRCARDALGLEPAAVQRVKECQ
jgi:hypothetical protein